jgi:lipopolysaccharide/colanic/teichoic acid biosynthesis glycosyltransferase
MTSVESTVQGATPADVDGLAVDLNGQAADLDGQGAFALDRARTAGAFAKRLLDIMVSLGMLVILAPLMALIAIAIKLESKGPVFYRCRRVGFVGRAFSMLKFRKMCDGAAGPMLTVARDTRFTRVGRFLALSKLDELPQLWNVLRGDMSLVGPRPEDETFVAEHSGAYERILSVRPGITGLSQLAFAKECEILDATDRLGDYRRRLLPQKIAIDTLYATNRSAAMDLRILLWTPVAVVARRDVAVARETGRLTLRRRGGKPTQETVAAAKREGKNP